VLARRPAARREPVDEGRGEGGTKRRKWFHQVDLSTHSRSGHLPEAAHRHPGLASCASALGPGSRFARPRKRSG
jgi:hypothetical protein